VTGEEFQSKMRLAEALADSGKPPEYYAGYMLGLRRHYHGEAFGTEEEHEKWLQLIGDEDEARREMGRGYVDGSAGLDPEA